MFLYTQENIVHPDYSTSKCTIKTCNKVLAKVKCILYKHCKILKGVKKNQKHPLLYEMHPIFKVKNVCHVHLESMVHPIFVLLA